MINFVNIAGISLGIGIVISQFNLWLGFITMINLITFYGVLLIKELRERK